MGNETSQPQQQNQYQYGKKSTVIRRPVPVSQVQQTTYYNEPNQQYVNTTVPQYVNNTTTPQYINNTTAPQNQQYINNEPEPTEYYEEHNVENQEVNTEQNEEEEDSSYRILGFKENQPLTQEELNKRYRSLALKFHPDRNKEPYSQYFFNLVKRAYKDLSNKLNLSIGDERRYQEADDKPLPEILPEREELNKGFSNIKINPDSFDIDKFNSAFSEFQTAASSSNPYAKGYADQMEKSSKQRQNSYAVDRISNSADFNRQFEKNKTQKQIQIYKEPEPILVNPALNYTELGQDSVDNFGAKINNSLHATDYMDAHVNENTLIDPSRIDVDRPDTLNGLKNARSQINYKMSARDKAFYDMKQAENEEKELERRERLKKQDEQQEKDFYLFNRMFLK